MATGISHHSATSPADLDNRCGTRMRRAVNEMNLHPKSTILGFVALGAIITLAVFIGHGSPLSGAADRALTAGVTSASIGLVAGTIFAWKKGTKQNEEYAQQQGPLAK